MPPTDWRHAELLLPCRVASKRLRQSYRTLRCVPMFPLVDRGEAVEFRSTQDEISFSPMKGAWLFGGHQGRQTMVNPVPAGGRGRIKGIPSAKRAKTPLIVLIVLSGRRDTVEFPIGSFGYAEH